MENKPEAILAASQLPEGLELSAAGANTGIPDPPQSLSRVPEE